MKKHFIALLICQLLSISFWTSNSYAQRSNLSENSAITRLILDPQIDEFRRDVENLSCLYTDQDYVDRGDGKMSDPCLINLKWKYLGAVSKVFTELGKRSIPKNSTHFEYLFYDSGSQPNDSLEVELLKFVEGSNKYLRELAAPTLKDLSKYQYNKKSVLQLLESLQLINDLEREFEARLNSRLNEIENEKVKNRLKFYLQTDDFKILDLYKEVDYRIQFDEILKWSLNKPDYKKSIMDSKKMLNDPDFFRILKRIFR